jgi:hypothetical protein
VRRKTLRDISERDDTFYSQMSEDILNVRYPFSMILFSLLPRQRGVIVQAIMKKKDLGFPC